jgi:hypothetical protein
LTAADWYYSKGSGKGKNQIMSPSQLSKHVFSVFYFLCLVKQSGGIGGFKNRSAQKKD